MAINYQNDFGYAHAKLSDSIIMHKNHPTYIASVDGTGMVEHKFLDNPHEDYKKEHLQHFDLTPVKLGYMNLSNGGAVYASRLPLRNWKQGLQLRQVVSPDLIRVQVGMESPAFVNTLLGAYPTIKKCVEFLVNQESKTLAFCREFALNRPNKKACCNLSYKGVDVGHLDLNTQTTTPILWEQFTFLRETLEEVLNENRS